MMVPGYERSIPTSTNVHQGLLCSSIVINTYIDKISQARTLIRQRKIVTGQPPAHPVRSQMIDGAPPNMLPGNIVISRGYHTALQLFSKHLFIHTLKMIRDGARLSGSLTTLASTAGFTNLNT
jgi:hypothetical protein